MQPRNDDSAGKKQVSINLITCISIDNNTFRATLRE